MKILRSVDEMQAACRELRRAGKRIGFVPTMGALHDGHISLVRSAKTQTDVVVASIFVNPLQFGPNEDLSQYPRTFDSDCKKLEAEGCELLFFPTNEEMYPPNATTVVHVEGLSEKLDGRSRPGHFRGVSTVVCKLFEIVRPDRAYFGQKDAAQFAVLRKMVRDLNMEIEMIVCPIVRERDGLAMSSRNAYLTPEQRKQALVLYRSLMRVQTLVDRGEANAQTLMDAGKEVVAEEPEVRLDYYEIIHSDTLDAVADVSHGALVAVVAYVGSTRLIDNLVLHGVGSSRMPG